MFKKLNAFIFFIWVLTIHNACMATIFFPLPFEKQIDEATSAVEVRLESARVFKSAGGMIMTEYSFDVLESYNLSSSDLDNQKLKLTMPGGTYEGITSMIDGAPQFGSGEKSFLLLKKIESKIYLSNFSLGKYKIQNDGGRIYYVSEVFPSDPQIGRISKEKMVELMKSKWKISSDDASNKSKSKSVVVVPEIKAPIKAMPEFEKREPAEESIVREEVPVFFWSAIVLVVFFFAFIFFKLGQSEHQHRRE
ncbi:MAG: hypothetical protein ACXVLQ_07610 [Bacteriovorax sp.]